MKTDHIDNAILKNRKSTKVFDFKPLQNYISAIKIKTTLAHISILALQQREATYYKKYIKDITKNRLSSAKNNMSRAIYLHTKIRNVENEKAAVKRTNLY